MPVLKNNQTNQTENLASAESRVRIIEDRLEQIIERGFDPGSLRVVSETNSGAGLPAVYIRYTQNGSPKQDELLTVTALDAEINGTNAQT